MKIEVRLEDPNWVPSTYFSRGYGHANADDGDSRWVTIADKEGRWQMPLLIRPVEAGLVDATTPYGYGGIYAEPALSPSEIENAWAQARSCLENLGVVSLFLRSSPFLPNGSLSTLELEGVFARRVSTTYLVQSNDVDKAWRALEGRARTAVRKARSNDMVASVRPATLQDFDPQSAFRELYQGTMDRLDASEQYYFSDRYYENLLEGLGNSLQLASVCDRHGNIVAAALLMTDQRNSIHYHLAGSALSAARLGANNLLVWGMVEWGFDNGFQTLHLGGGYRESDGLDRFKRSFGGERRAFEIGQLIVRPDAYSELVGDRARTTQRSAADLYEGEFFPAYRG